MSDSNASQKDEENDPCKEPVKKCPHEFCHRDQIESDKPIGLPFASGLLQYIPGQEPDPYNFKLRKILKKRKCIEKVDEEVAKKIDACPPILENLLTNDPEIADEMKYLFNFVLEVGDNDVGEYVNIFKENMAKDREAKEAKEAEEASAAAEASVSRSVASSAGTAGTAGAGSEEGSVGGEEGEEEPPAE